jgi:fatty acid/phospholipid biosynthesis enzyme
MNLTEAGINAMAEELHHQASMGKPWNQASREVRQDLIGIVNRMIERACGAEAEREAREQDQQTNRRGILP